MARLARLPRTSTPARCATSTRCPTADLLMVASDRISAFDFVLPTADPRQGPDPHPAVAVVVRPARRPRAQPRRLDRRAGRGPRAGRWSASGSRCSRSSASPAATSTGSGLLDYRATGAVCGIAAARRAWSTAPGCPSRSSRPATKAAARRARRERRPTTRSSRPSARTRPRELRDLTLAVYAPGRGDRPRARHHPGRHQARVRPSRRRHDRARRRGAHPRLVPLLAGRRVAARPRRSRRTTSSSCATG